MRILLYTTESMLGEKLHVNIKDLAPSEAIDICRTFDNLSTRLHGPTYDLFVAVLAISHRQELLEILSLREWFQDIRIILLLPDKDRETVSMGHSLHPRFISYLDSNFMMTEISDVFSKMLKYIYNNQLSIKK